MKTYNVYFENSIQLYHFIASHNIAKSKNVLVQLFIAQTKKSVIDALILKLKEYIPHAKIIGTTTDGEILSDTVSEGKTVISFSVFDSTTIETILINKKDIPIKKAVQKIGKQDSSKTKCGIIFTTGLTQLHHFSNKKY